MLDKIKKHKMTIAILALLIASNLFTVALFYNEQIKPFVNISDNDTPEGQANIISDSEGFSVNGDVTNNQPIVSKTEAVVKNPTKVPVYGTRTLYESASFYANGTPTPNTRAWRISIAPSPQGGYYVIYATKEEKYITGYEYK